LTSLLPLASNYPTTQQLTFGIPDRSGLKLSKLQLMACNEIEQNIFHASFLVVTMATDIDTHYATLPPTHTRCDYIN
jgi:hypothetical protein